MRLRKGGGILLVCHTTDVGDYWAGGVSILWSMDLMGGREEDVRHTLFPFFFVQPLVLQFFTARFGSSQSPDKP